VKEKQHKDKAMVCVSSSNKSIRSFFTPQDSSAVINAEALWATFVVMFPDSGVSKKWACGRIKTSAIITEALGPYHDRQMLGNFDKNCLFSVMMDE